MASSSKREAILKRGCGEKIFYEEKCVFFFQKRAYVFFISEKGGQCIIVALEILYW